MLSPPHFRWGRGPSILLAASALVPGCDAASRPGDTEGLQQSARWEWHGRLRVETDSLLTITRLRVDSGLPERHDILLVRYDFDPTTASAGDEYALTVGLDLGVVRDLPLGQPLTIGTPPARIPAAAIVTCLCRPLRPDSVRGTLWILQRGIRQITGRIDATLYFTAWHDSTVHTAYRVRQALYGVK